MRRSEGFFQGAQQLKLYFQVWEPEEDSKGLLVITHGHGEHSESYHRLVEALDSFGWTLLAWDLRGHGRSQGHRGFAKSFSDYSRDFEILVKQVVPEWQRKKPRVFFGHSMGALVQMSGLARLWGGDRESQILCSPYLGLKLEVPVYKEAAARLLRSLVPQVTLYNEIRDEDLTRDPSVIEEFEKDTLRHHKISSGVHLGAKETQAWLLSQPQIWKGALLMLLAEDDPVVSSELNRKFFSQLSGQDQTLCEFADRRHELINDIGREEIFEAIQNFLSARVEK